MSRAQPGNRCPRDGENVRYCKGSHEKRTVSFEEWLVKVKLSILGMFILQSPNSSWFDDGTIKEKVFVEIKQHTKIETTRHRKEVHLKV